MLRFAAAALTIFCLAVPATAQNVDVIKERKALLKEMGDATKPLGPMSKGEAPVDVEKVKEVMRIFQKNAEKLPTLFPDDSKTGGETKALPDLWEKKDDVTERFKKLVATSKQFETDVTAENFADGWKDMLGNCGGCHKLYKQKDE
jgi:cytochrome c556